MLTAPSPQADLALPAAAAALEEASLTWQVHLLRNQPERLPRVCCALILVLIGGFFIFHNILLAVVPTMAVLLSLTEFLFPIRYTLTQDGAQSRQGPIVIEMPWSDVRHVYLAADGVKLSPLRKPGSRMEPLRGVFLRFAGNEQSVIQAVQRFREAPANG